METQLIPLSHAFKKRKRKSSLPENASSPKTSKPNSPDAKLKGKPSVKINKKNSPKKFELPVNTALKTENKIPDGITGINDIVSHKLKTFKPKLHSQIKPKSTGDIAKPLKKKKKKVSITKDEIHLSHIEALNEKPPLVKVDATKQKTTPKKVTENMKSDKYADKFPILKNKELIEKCLKVPMSNNQKGRIRQALKLSLQGSSNMMFPDIINGKIEAILNSAADLTDSDLRRIRLLHNMLKTALEAPSELLELKPPKNKKNKKKKEKSNDTVVDEKQEKKAKGPKRYVVFLGNLPLNVNKEMIMNHFRELNTQIKDIRIPKVAVGTKSAIAYVELTNEPSFELALSKHHSMLENKRIKVLYTTQQKSKISRSEAKGKSAKLIALQKSGKLVGSLPVGKTRSHRRAIMKKAKAKESAASA